MTTKQAPILENLELHECHEVGVFNASYFITAGREEDTTVVCRFPTGCGEYSEQKPIAEHVLRCLNSGA